MKENIYKVIIGLCLILVALNNMSQDREIAALKEQIQIIKNK